MNQRVWGGGQDVQQAGAFYKVFFNAIPDNYLPDLEYLFY